MKRALAGLSLLVACGGNAAPPPPSAPTSPASSSPARKHEERPRVEVEYVVIHQKWVAHAMSPSGSDLAAWYETPEGRAAVPAQRRQMAFSTKKKAEAALARLKKGDPWEKVLATSENVMSQTPFAKVDTAFDGLGAGDMTVVEDGGFAFLVKKERPTDDAIEKAYDKSKAPELTAKLAAAILARWKKGESDARAMMAETVGDVLGESAVADPDRPAPVVVDEPRFRTSRVPPKAKAEIDKMLKDGKAGDLVAAPIVEGDVAVVARAVPPRR